jgi:Flp pilus assembly protein TadG
MTRSMRQFREDERGAMAFFMIFLFLLMIMFGGIAVDVMRFETRRVAMQQTMDRAALAAASLTQTRTPTAIANDWFDKAGLGEELVMVDFSDPTVDAFNDAGLRRVTITSKVRSENFFMTIYSDNEFLEGPTNTQAAQGVSQIEVMLVLDITGSMSSPAVAGGTKSKIEALRESAAEFVSIVKGNDSKNGVSIGLVPYASQVNLPENLRKQFNETHVSAWNGVANAGVPYINCLEVPTSSYTATAISTTTAMPMAAVADFNSVSATGDYLANSGFPVSTIFGRSVCGTTPDNAGTTTINEALDNHVTLPTKDGSVIEAKIARLTAAGNTSIALGMRWGVGLIDQAARPIYTAIGDASVAGRPADNSSTQTRKIIILMTDGEHVANNHIKDAYKVGLSPIYRGATDGKFAIRFWSASTVALNTGTRPHANCSGWVLATNREYFIPHLKATKVKAKVGNQAEGAGTGTEVTAACDPLAWKTTPSWTGSGTVTQLDWSEVWRYMRVDYLARQLYMRSNVNGTSNNGTVLNVFRQTYISVTDLNTYLARNCTAAKAAGIEIYGIAFAAPANGQTQISNCSSDPKVNYYYNAEDNAKLTAAFHQIAVDISELRLTQ